MGDNFSVNEIKHQSALGAKWLFLSNSLNIPISFFTAFFLGRTSPEALGALGLVQVFIGVITTFIFFGGPTVLRNFMSKANTPSERGRLFLSYAFILALIMIAALAFFALFPNLLSILLKREVSSSIFVFLFLFTFIVISFELFSSAIAGLMDIKTTAITQAVTRFFPLPLVAFFFFFNRHFLQHYAWYLILGAFLASFVIGVFLNARAFRNRKDVKLERGFYFPTGFFAFCLTTHIATIFSFAYNDLDRIFMYQLAQIGGLGIYQAVISIARFIDFAPQAMSATFVPAFSNLLASGNSQAIIEMYNMVQRYSVIIITAVSLFTISFSKQLLGVFGLEYQAFSHVLSLFAVSSVLCSLFLGNTTILISYERNIFRLAVSTLQILIQTLGTLLFMPFYGVLAIVGFKVGARVVANILNIIYVIKMDLGIFLPRIYLIAIFSCMICVVIQSAVLAHSLLSSAVSFLVASVIFIFGGHITTNDVNRLIIVLKK